MPKNKNFLLIELGGEMKLFILRELIQLGAEIFVAQQSFPDYFNGLIDETSFIKADPDNSIELLTNVFVFMQKTNIAFDGVGTYFEHAVPNTALLAQTLGLPGIPPGIAFRSSNLKIAMRGLSRKHDLRMPKYLFMHKPQKNDLSSKVKMLGGDAIIKPIFGNNSHGVARITAETDLDDVLSYLKNSCQIERESIFAKFNEDFLLEAFVKGTQISVDGIIQNSLIHFAGITEIEMGEPPYFHSCANFIPPRIDEKEYRTSLNYCRRVIEALGFNDCGFHCELKLGERGPELIEIACRPPGGKIMEGYKLAYGIDLVRSMFDLWMDNPVNISRRHSTFIYQAGIFSYESGVLESVSGIAEARNIIGVREATQVLSVGEKIVTHPEMPVPICYICIEAPSRAELAIRTIKTTDAIKFKISSET